MLVDSHCHVSHDWYEPVEMLLAQMDRCGVASAWLVQLLGRFDNDYALGCRRAHSDRFAVIGGVDWMTTGALAEVDRLVDDGALGLRLRPNARSPGAAPLAIWQRAADLGLVVSCVGTAAQFASHDFAALLGALPGLTVVLEHLGGLARPDAGDLALAMPPVLALARYPGVRLKLTGLGQLLTRAELSPPPATPDDPKVAVVAAVIAAFGAERLLWGSDFPVVSSREGYANALDWARAVVPPPFIAAIFGGNARFETASQRSVIA